MSKYYIHEEKIVYQKLKYLISLYLHRYREYDSLRNSI